MANNIGRVRLFVVNIGVTTSDEPPGSFLRAFRPEIVSKGRHHGITHCLLGEKFLLEHDQKGTKFCTNDDHVATSTSRFSVVDEDDEVETLSTAPVSRSPDPPPPVELSTAIVPVYNPVPLRCIPPTDFWFSGYNGNAVGIFAPHHMDATLNLNSAGSRNSGEKRGKSRKRRQNNVSDDRKKRRKRDIGNAADQNLYPKIPPGLLQMVESRNGTRPVFLYRKKLEKSDASGHLNRLFVNRREKFEQFLSKEEETALNNGLGLEIFGVDSQGRLYKLCLKIWESVETLVVKSGWNKLVNGNDAKRGDWTEMWGYRENEKPRLAINFRKSEA